MLAPARYMKFLSYITGWLAVIGWQTAFASSAYLSGTEIQGVAILANKAYNALSYQGTLIMWATLVVALLSNLVGGRFLPRLEGFILIIHILGFFAIIIPLTCMSDHKTDREVFLEFLNGGQLCNPGLVVVCRSQRMAEEVANASVAIPCAIMLSVLINGSLGFGMLIGILYCAGDIDAALNSPTGYPYIEIFYQGTGFMSGTLTMCSILLIIGIASCIGMLAATFRQFWSFARDRGVPGWRVWTKISFRHLPVYGTLLTTIISTLLGLINIGSEVALNDILSMAVSGIYSSYLIARGLLLYRRCKGDISRYNESDETTINVPGAKLAVVYMMIVIFFSYWPSSMDPSVQDMNYSVVGTVGVVFLAIVYYFVRARHVYQGPVMETS
ncbi:amino acid transporter [Penicillium maclennaniae]|uniref:amino acid transporter n=1 Tax=Penicillium maclennaniae TaxID=1343394 RepID=UPI002540CCA5|nr:amino acid transporter [Penicillium maclennaniae]KAJ5684641.1 amino acid transporter [Penicillium maclennaniae]